MFYLILSILLLLPLGLFSKENKDNKSAIVDSLLEKSYESKLNVEIESAIEYAYRALSISDEIGYSRGKAKSYLNLGQTLFYLGSYEKSLEFLSLAEKEPFAKNDPAVLFELSRVRGQIFSYLNLSNQSIREFIKCLDIAQKIEPKKDRDYCMSLTYENMSIVYGTIDDSDSVLYYMNRNRELLESLDESIFFSNLVNLYSSFGSLYSKVGDFELAKEFFDKALELTDKYQYRYQSRTYIYLGDMELYKENPDSAMYYYKKALENLEVTKIKSESSVVYGQMADLFRQMGNEDSVRFYTEKQNIINEELTTERLNSVKPALQIFIEEERINNSKKRIKEFTYISISSIILIVLIFLVSKNSRKKLLLKKEKEEKMLQAKLQETIKQVELKKEKTKELEQKLNESFSELIELAKTNAPAFLKRFQEIYPEPTKRLLKEHPNLTNTELNLAAMIFLNFPSKDIATYTFVEHRTVQTKKNRLRKKLNLPAGASIEHYLSSFSD
jgi:tetratricopeptide (TPR) repeat protein